MNEHINLSISDLEDLARRCIEAAGTLRLLQAHRDRVDASIQAPPPIEVGPQRPVRERVVEPRQVTTTPLVQPPAATPAARRCRTPRAPKATGDVSAPAPREETAKAAAGAYDAPIIRLVGEHSGLKLTEIAHRLHTSVSTIHGVLKRLVTAQQIVRDGPGYFPVTSDDASGL